MTIHSTHPFADPDPDPVRRFRGRLGGAVTLWTAGSGADRVGLTITSVMLANGEPPRLLALADPDSDLHDALVDGRTAVVQVLAWPHRQLADAFAGTSPAPGGVFAAAAFEQTDWGPRLADVRTWAGVRLESTAEVGWSSLVTCVLEHVVVGDDVDPLGHRRGRYLRLAGSDE